MRSHRDDSFSDNHFADSLTRLRRALLEIIVIRLANSRETVEEYASKTLLAHSGNRALLAQCVSSGLESLLQMKYVEKDTIDCYQATTLGKAIVASALDPDDGTFIHDELARALQAFVMDGDMHILYTFTPVQDNGSSINWQIFRNEIEGLDDSGHRVLGLLGLKPAVINRLQVSRPPMCHI